MSMQGMITTLQDFLERWLTDAGFRDQYDGDLEAAMDDHGLHDVEPAELLECLPLVAEDLPLAYQRSIYDYMNTVNTVNTGSTFNVQQGGSHTTGAAEGTAAVAASAQTGPYPGEEPLDAVVRHVYNVQNVYETNYSYIEDNDVVTTITADGDVDFDQNVASGDGAFAGDNAEGIVQGDNYGINAGDNVLGAEVTNVTGDDNVVGNELGDGANLVTGDVGGNFVGDDVEDSVLIGDDNYGQAVGDGENANIIGGDSGIAVTGGGGIGDVGNVNVGGTQYAVEGDGNATAFGGDAAIDNSTNITDSYNTDNSINDSTFDNDVVDDKDVYDDKDFVDHDDQDVVDDKDVVDHDDNDAIDVL